MHQTLANISPKTAFYFSNGSGRDSYIAVNNGGMTVTKGAALALDHGKQTVLNREGGFPRPKGYVSKSPVIDAKHLFYHSDGSGRDSYVT
ncbi:MAG: hypothetical protein P4M11_12860 [Candidatus Pacebacteria bacterium]|nr:hypothetical protein [Candidatus Paceibacterota bacterium]